MDLMKKEEPARKHSASSLFEVLHKMTLVFLEEMMDQLDRWTYEQRFHSYRVSVLAYEVGKRMSLPTSRLMTLRAGALLHDIGKIRIDQNILNKSGSLTEAEWAIVNYPTDKSGGLKTERS